MPAERLFLCGLLLETVNGWEDDSNWLVDDIRSVKTKTSVLAHGDEVKLLGWDSRDFLKRDGSIHCVFVCVISLNVAINEVRIFAIFSSLYGY